MMGFYGDGMSVAGWIFMGLFWAALIVLIVWMIIAIVSPTRGTISGGRAQRSVRESPAEILSRRLAQGEIDIETYDSQRQALARVY